MSEERVWIGPKVALLVLGLAGCGADAPSTLTILGEAVPTTQALAELASQYEAQSGIRIDVEQYEFETAVQRATLDLSSRTGFYDIILQPHLSLGRFVTSDLLEPFDDFLLDVDLRDPGFNPETDLFEAFWRELSWYEGRVYGYPFTANTMYVAYRSDLLSDPVNRAQFRERYGYALDAPATWAEYRDVAEFFTRPDDNLFGTALQGRRHPAVWYEWLNFVYSWGGGVFEKDHGWEYGPITLACPPAVEATEYYRSLLAYAPPGTTEYTWDDQLADMQQGRIAMAVMWSDTIPALEDSAQSRHAGQFGYAMLPRGAAGQVGQIAGWSFHISRFSDMKEEAYRFIEWVLRPENQVAQQLSGGASALKATYDDPRIQELPYTDAYTGTLAIASAMSDSFPEASGVSDQLQICISEILASDIDVREQLKACAQQVRDVIEQQTVAIACESTPGL